MKGWLVVSSIASWLLHPPDILMGKHTNEAQSGGMLTTSNIQKTDHLLAAYASFEACLSHISV